jgi:hypothetical protein
VSNLINYQYLGFTIDPAKYPKLKKYADGVVRAPNRLCRASGLFSEIEPELRFPQPLR